MVPPCPVGHLRTGGGRHLDSIGFLCVGRGRCAAIDGAGSVAKANQVGGGGDEGMKTIKRNLWLALLRLAVITGALSVPIFIAYQVSLRK